MKEYLHLVVSQDIRPSEDGDWRIKNRVWVIDQYRAGARLNPDNLPEPVDTIEIDAKHLLVVQPGVKFHRLLLDGMLNETSTRLRWVLPLKAPIHIHGLTNTPSVVTGKEEQE